MSIVTDLNNFLYEKIINHSEPAAISCFCAIFMPHMSTLHQITFYLYHICHGLAHKKYCIFPLVVRCVGDPTCTLVLLFMF